MMKAPLAIACLATVIVGTGAASAAESRPIPRGTDGLVEVPFRADNDGPGDMACAVALAHWYSQDLGKAAPGGSVRAALWYDPRDGEIMLLNALQDHMPVQMLWCGAGARSWTGRAVIRLERKAEAPPPPIHVTCRTTGETLACR